MVSAQWFSGTTTVHPPSDTFLVPRTTLYEQSIDPNCPKKRRMEKGLNWSSQGNGHFLWHGDKG